MGVDGQTRDAKGNLRFNKNTKRIREEEKMFDLDELEEGGKKVQERRKKRMEMGKLGGEFKAKVILCFRFFWYRGRKGDADLE